MAGEKAKYEHASEKLAIAEVTINSLLSAAAVSVQSAGFNSKSQVLIIHEKSKAVVNNAISSIRAKIATSQANITKTLNDLMEYQRGCPTSS
jgi:hypothetical protein